MPKTERQVECPECGKLLNAQGLGGHMYIVHGRRAGRRSELERAGVAEVKIDELGRRVERLQSQFEDYSERIDRFLDGLLELARNLVETAEGVQSGGENREKRIMALEKGLEILKNK